MTSPSVQGRFSTLSSPIAPRRRPSTMIGTKTHDPTPRRRIRLPGALRIDEEVVRLGLALRQQPVHAVVGQLDGLAERRRRQGTGRDPLEDEVADRLAVDAERPGGAGLDGLPDRFEERRQPVLDAVRGHEERRGGRDRFQDAVAAIERPADLGLPDGRADDPGGGPQRVELRPGPVALLVGVVVADVAPPPAADRDRGHDDRADPVRLEEDPLIRRQLAEVPGHQVPGRQLALPAPEVAEPARVLGDRQRQRRPPRPTRPAAACASRRRPRSARSGRPARPRTPSRSGGGPRAGRRRGDRPP